MFVLVDSVEERVAVLFVSVDFIDVVEVLVVFESTVVRFEENVVESVLVEFPG